MNLNLKQLETFVWVATLKSFRATAERLNTTQPNISVRISSLEAEVGAKLFERDAGSVILTSTGSLLLEYARRVLTATDEFIDQAGKSATTPGIIRLGVTEMIAQTWLSDFLRELRAQYPNLAVELVVDLSAELRRNLIERSIDLGFLNGPISDPSIHNTDLCEMPLMWVAAPELVDHSENTDLFSSHPVFTPARNTRPFAEIDRYFRENTKTPVKLIPSNNLAACLQMTVDGLGLANLPKVLAQSHLDQGTLVEAPYPWGPNPLIFTASYAHTPSNSTLKKASEIAKHIAGSAV